MGRANDARSHGRHGTIPAGAGGRTTPPQTDPAAILEVMDALNDASASEAGREQAERPPDEEAGLPHSVRWVADHRGGNDRVEPRWRRSETDNRASGGSPAAARAWQGARRRSFVDSGGVAARLARPAAGAAFDEPLPGEALEVSDGALLALFGRDRTALLRVVGMPMQVDRQKEWKLRNAQKRQMEATGKQVPADFCPQVFFYTFQFERASLLACSPVLVRELEQWAWMHGRWAISDVSDMSKSSDFLHILRKADELAESLDSFSDDLRRRPGLPVSQTLRQDVSQLMLRFTAVRARFVADTVASGIGMPDLSDLHREFAIIGRIYAHDSASLPGFLKNVDEQTATQSAVHTDKVAREDYCSKAFVCVARAFIHGLKGGAAPMNPNPLDDPPATSAGAGAATTRPPPTMIQSQQIALTAPPSLTPAAAAVVWPPTPPVYTTAQQPLEPPAPGHGTQPSVDVMARQTAAGFRAAGPLLGGFSGGGAEGIDLTPTARLVLYAQQILHGIRAAGALVSMPPPGELPPVSSYPPPLVGAPPAPMGCPGLAATVRPWGTPDGSQPPPLYTTSQRSNQQAGKGGGGGGSLYSTAQSAPQGQSDELYIPYSTGLLGSFSPYRGLPIPSGLTCYECGAFRQHYANECPARFVRVRGEPPPGWKVDRQGAVAKEATDWVGDNLTDAARARFGAFLDKLSLVAHGTHPVSREEILGPSPVPPRRPLPKLGPSWGGWRR